MKWIIRILVVLAVLAAGLVAAVFMTAMGSERPVGFQGVQASDADGKPFTVGVWYPTEARPWPMLMGPVLMKVAQDGAVAGSKLPLVVISHGNGGGPGGHADLALALASAGYVVAAPMHTGDNFADQSAAGAASLFSGRNRQLRATVDFMLKAWSGHDRIDPERIGAFGFSAGGFTVLTAVGAQPDMRLIAKQCATAPEFVCEVLRAAKSALLNPETAATADAFLPDVRIKAAVLAAPGLGFTITPEGFANVRVPVQLWHGEKDDKVPYATNAKLVREGLGARVEYRAVPGAAHLSFLAPCGLLKPPMLCSDPGEFDRKAFHATMNPAVLAFFEKNLKRP